MEFKIGIQDLFGQISSLDYEAVWGNVSPNMIRMISTFAAVAAISMVGVSELRSEGPPSVDWNTAEDQVSVSIDSLDLEAVLKTIASETGWAVRYQPNLGHVISVKFEDEDQRTALRRLLAPLNFSLIIPKNSPGQLVVYRESISRATESIVAEAAPSPLPEIGFIGDELIVVLKPDSPYSIEELAARLGATIIDRNDELRAYVLKFDNDESATRGKEFLALERGVTSVENNQRIASPTIPQPISLGTGAVNYSLKAGKVDANSPIIIGVVDTGFNPGNSSLGDLLLGQLSLAGNVENYPELTHGQVMTETILANLFEALNGADETGVRFATADIYGNSSATTSFLVGQALTQLFNEYDVTQFNLSLGGSEPSPFVEGIIASLSEKGVTIVAAAGNEPTSDPSYPAAYDPVLSITAGTNGDYAEYANRDETVDAMASGQSIVQSGDQLAMATGTSVAAAQISGMIAGVSESTGTSATIVASQIPSTMPPPSGE